MKRIISILLCLTVIFSLLSLTACHGKEMLPEFVIPEGGLDSSKTYEITFWAKNDSNPVQVEIYEQLIRDFEKIYPNIKVKLNRYTNYGLIYQDVITNIGTRTTPNVCITYPDHIATYNTSDNIVIPLDSLMADEKYGLGGSEIKFDAPRREEIIESFLSEGIIDGEQYALPFMRSTEACYVNADLVRALGFELPEVLSWEFIWQVCESAMVPTGTSEDGEPVYANGKTNIIPFIYKSTDNMMIQYLAQAGADYSTPDGDVLFFNDTAKELLADVAAMNKKGAFSTFSAVGYPGNFFNRGECIFAVDSTAGATWMGPDAPLVDIPADQIVDFECEVLPVPQINPDEPKMISQGPSICVFNKTDPGEVLASWIFAQYLLTDGVQIAFSQTEGYVPVTESAQSSEAYVDYLSRAGEDTNDYYDVKIKASKIMLDNLESTFVTPVFNGSASVRSASGEMIESVVKANSRRQPTDAAAIEKMYGKVFAQYHLDQLNMSFNERAELGKMPAESIALIVTLGVLWGGLVAWLGIKYYLRRKTDDKS